MAVSQSYNVLWSTGILLVILPHFSLGLLSDYKICGDSECESLMSRVQAIRDHRGKDCRFLSFRKGDTIFVYHKLTGKRDDLWAGSIDKQFGYFPKDAVKEEQVHAAVEKVVETQESDFFCMDELGYIIDSSHLDSDDDDYDDKIQNQESEITQTTTYTEDTGAESPSTSEEDPTEPPLSARDTDDTSTEADESENAEDAAPETQMEAREAPAAPGEQGGSASSPWLSSSVTGWLGLATEDEPGEPAEGGTKDERTETQAEASFTSSVTGWLGLGGDGKPDDIMKNTEDNKESADSLTSTMTGWLGLGGENKKDHSVEEREADEEKEPTETFRSRRMSLDLEGSQLHEEEKEEMGTLDWLGNGLSNTLGFGVTNQEAGHEGATEREAEETVQKEEGQSGSGSWFDVGIGDILGFRKEKSEADERTESGLKEREEIPVDTSQSPPSLTEEEIAQSSNASKVEDPPKDQTVPSEIEIVSGTNNNDGGSLDSSRDTVSSEDVASEDNQKDIDLLEEKSEAVGGMSSMLDSEEEEEHIISEDIEKEENILDGERSVEMKGEDHKMPKSIENVDDNNRGPRKDKGHTHQDFFTQYDINLGSDSARSLELNVDSTEPSVGEEDKKEKTVEERSDIQNKIYDTDESTDKSGKSGSREDDHEGEGSNADIDELQREVSLIHADGSAEQIQVSGAAEQRYEPVSTEEDTLTAHREENNTYLSDSLAIIGNNTDTETNQGELGQGEQGHPVEDSSQWFGSSSNQSTEMLSDNASEEDRRSFSASESTPEMEDDADQNSVSPDMRQSEGDAHKLKKMKKASEDNLQAVQTEASGLEEYVLNESGLKSGTGSETETDEDEEERQDEVEELKEEEKSQEIKKIREEVKEEDHHNKVEEVKKEEKQGEEEELKKEEKGDELEEVNEEREQEKGEELQGEKRQEEVEELKEEEKLQQTEESIEENQKLKLLNEEETREKLEMVEDEKKKEAKEEEKQVESSHFKAEMENTDRAESERTEKGTQGENILESVLSEMPTQTEKRETECPQVKEEERVEENGKWEGVEEVKDDMKEGEGERSECENELCPHASRDGLVRDGDENNFENKVTAAEEAEIVTGKQNPMNDNDQILADRTGVSQAVPSEGMETDEDRKQDEEENRNYDAEADEGVKEQGEKKNSDSDITGSEGVKSNNADSFTDFNGKTDYTDNDLLPSGESGQNSISKLDLLGKTADDKEDDQPYSSEAKNTNFSNDKVLHQGDETKPEDTETSNNEISNEKKTKHLRSDQKIDTEKETDKEEGDIHVKDDDVRVNEDAQHPASSSLVSDGLSEGIAETKSGGALGLFSNAFSFFHQTPSTESTESEPSLESVETSGSHTPLTPEQEMESTTDSTQVHVEDLHTNSTIVLLEQQQQPTPLTVMQTSFPPTTQADSHPSSLSPTTGSPLQTKTLSKHYKNLLTYMNAHETTVLKELFGGHKLQFLDYKLGKTDSTMDDPDRDESIVLDIERLLHYHRETLVAPSMRLADAPQEDKKKTSALIALQKLEMLLGRVRETFNKAQLDVSKTNHQDTDETIKGGSNKMSASSVGLDNNAPRDEQTGMDKEKVRHLSGGIGKEWVTEGPGVMNRMLDFVHQMAEDSTTHVHAARELTTWLTVQVVSSLPDDIRPGPDLYGVPWEPVIITSFVGLMTMLLFTCRCYSSVKSRLYRSKERWMAEQVAQLLDEKCKVLETLSKCQQEYDDLENSLRDSGVLAQTQKTEHLEGKARQLGHAKRELERDLNQLKDRLDQQKDHRIEQERRIAVLEENMKTFDEEIKDLQSQDEQAQTTLKVYDMNSDRLQRNLETAGEENTLLQESNAQLRQQVEGWAERVSELDAEMSRCEATHSGMLQDVANKDERIMSLTDRLLSMKAWDSDLEEEEREEGGEKETSNGTAGKEAENGKGGREDTQGHLQKVQKLIYAAKLNADLKSVDEDKDRAFAKLNDEVKAKEDLLVGIKELENEKLSLQSSTEHYSDQVQRLQQKLHIMTEMYQENELKLHRLLTVEEKERLQKEDKLNKADKNIALAMEELNNYRQRAGEMEEELEKSKQSYQTQISAHEKKAHNNWLAARAADRELSDIRRENALLRQKLTDTQFKLDALDKDPYALDNLARPLPFRAERSPYGPSPLGRPASETRPFLSPPTLMDGPPARLSPRVPRGPVEPSGGHGEMERSGGPHSDSGSISPTWERDRRGPPTGPPGHLGPPGYMFPEPGGPMYRRPLPPPGALGHLPPLGSLPPGPLHLRGLPPGPPHPVDMADGSYRENSLGPGEQEHREQFGPDRRTPPEGDPRLGGAPPPGPLMGPMDGPFPRRSPYGPPPPDFYPLRGPGAPPMMPMWAPPPPGMMFPPPRFSAGGPPLPPAPHPQHVPTMRPSLPVGLPPPSMATLPPQQSLPSPPHNQSPEEHTPMPEDAI
ncbi:melanoma inhibitory activity protein 2 isoform X3 [Acanthopagrus latus]|uniref:melanoma inhibitory activity protein 2 isoform X3 n=1 Tax=Acanthopagrus latus TaxID=8177 RepID=UPI00187BF7DA|nr:melanoma inhibitory activity protein 2 isoform X3 [Acanthopagrus latus]